MTDINIRSAFFGDFSFVVFHERKDMILFYYIFVFLNPSLMKKLYTLILFFSSTVSFSQVITNGSFENNNAPDLTGWDNQFCGSMLSAAGGCPGGGSWHMDATAGNTQSCFPEYVYQKFPNIVNGQLVSLDGWAYTDFVNYPVSIGIGKINNNTITQLISASTVSTTWTQLNVSATYNLGVGDTAIVICYPGMTFGPGNNVGHFDLLSMNLFMGVTDASAPLSVTIFPNPSSGSFTIGHAELVSASQTLKQVQGDIKVYNTLGELVFCSSITDNSTTINLSEAPKGIYFITVTTSETTITQKLIIQ